MKLKKISSVLLCVLTTLVIASFAVYAEGDVASIGDTTYPTLAEAVTAANAMDGDVTITLLQDTTFNQAMTISNNITIEGAYTLTRDDAYTGTLFTVNADKSLTLNDLTIDGNNNWTFDDEAFYQAAINNVTGKDISVYYTPEENAPVATEPMIVISGSVTLNNATVKNNAGTGSNLGESSIFYGNNASSLTLTGATITHCANTGQNAVLYTTGNKVIINEGTLISDNLAKSNGSVMDIRAAEMIMNGGEIINNYGYGGNGVAIMLMDSNNRGVIFTMNGGLISGNVGANGTGGAIIYIHTNAKMIMNGGEISNNTGYASTLRVNKSSSSLTIYDGYIINNTSVGGNLDISPGSGTVALYGGEYTSNVSAYCASGYSLCGVDEDDDGEVDVYKAIKMIEVQFEHVSELDTEIERYYNINLITTDTNLVNKLEYVDLKFAFEQTEKWIGYEINATNENVDVNFVDNITPRYEFRFDELDTPAEETNKITIGQVKFTGYGAYTFAVDETADTNAAYIKDDVEDDLVDIYIPEVVAGDGYLDIISSSIEETVPMPKRKLTVNVNFSNPIEYKTSAYQSMTVKIAGGNVSKEIALGNESIDETLDETVVNPATISLSEDGYTISLDLPYNTVYTVIVEGAGYRTGRYSVELSDNKTLNFWNNVKNTAEPIEEGSDVMVKHNFLAGDIIKDDNINLYDLSAILSYFGAKGISETNNPEYVKYDINRDGVIDSKDVAYILVAWGE